ncbi:MAG: hypothetical protein NDJ24_05730 [Alphaproteobacteria bacterium]|nr:hypothetical protein [Alphaproteobacteria bacterium]
MHAKNSLKQVLLGLILLGILIAPPAGAAWAQAMIMPLRVTFESRDRTADIVLFNPSNTAAVTYKLGWLNRAMTEDGNYKVVEGPLNPEFDPETAILFSPRQVTLPPGGKQKIRLSLRRPADLPDGEYRAHLNLQRVGASSRRNVPSNAPEGVTVQMGMNFGIAIPVIVRQGGPYDTTATIGKPSFIPASADGKQPAKVKFDIIRGGKYSANGKVTVFWAPPGDKERQISVRTGVKIYHEITRLEVTMPLEKGLTQLTGGSLRIVFEGEEPDEDVKFDEKTFPIGG